MKKYLLSTLAVVGILACTTAVSAETLPGPYFVGEAGMGLGRKDNKESGIFGVGLGYHVNDFMRADMTIGYRPWGKIDFDDDEADLWSVPVMFNAYAKYPISRSFDIYGMGGLGLSYNKTKSITNASGKSRTEFAWTVGAGIDYYVNECWSVDLGYRYTDLGQARVSGKEGYTGQGKKDVRSNDIKLSLRYYF